MEILAETFTTIRRTIMKHKILPATLVVVLFATLVIVLFGTFSVGRVPTVQARDDNTCSNARAAGKFGFTTTGTIFIPGPVSVAAVGSFTLDAAGNLVGSQNRSLNGNIAHETISGVVSLNPDCTFKLTADVFRDEKKDRTATLEGVFVDNMRESRSIFTSTTSASGANVPTVLTTDAKRLFSED